MGRVKEYYQDKLGQEAMENAMSKKQAPPLAKKVCLSTDDYFKKQWDEAELIVNKLKVTLQYPTNAPEDLNQPNSFEEINNFNEWIKHIYHLSTDLSAIAEDVMELGKKNGQIERNYLEGQEDDGFQGYDKPSDYL